MVPWVHQSSTYNRHLDRFSRFCRAHKRDQQTHTHTKRQTTLLLCNNRLYLVIAVMRSKRIRGFEICGFKICKKNMIFKQTIQYDMLEEDRNGAKCVTLPCRQCRQLVRELATRPYPLLLL